MAVKDAVRIGQGFGPFIIVMQQMCFATSHATGGPAQHGICIGTEQWCYIFMMIMRDRMRWKV